MKLTKIRQSRADPEVYVLQMSEPATETWDWDHPDFAEDAEKIHEFLLELPTATYDELLRIMLLYEEKTL